MTGQRSGATRSKRSRDEPAMRMTEPVDLRLGIGALAGWAAVLWGLGHSGGVVGVAAGCVMPRNEGSGTRNVRYPEEFVRERMRPF